MTDTASNRYGARQQSQGSNVNSWGDDKLNEVLRLFDRGSKGVQSLAITGDTTLSWTNYVATNDGQCAVLILTGSLSSAANLVVPSKEWVWDVIKNSTGQTITVKTSAGTGISIPNGRYAQVYCDGVDCYNGTSSQIPTNATISGSLTVAGQVSGVVAGTASTDATNVAQVSAAIATAGLPASAGTVLNSINDTTASYLSQKITLSFSTATTTQLSGLLSVQLGTDTPSGNEKLKATFGAPYVGGFVDGGSKVTGFTPLQGYAYDVDCTLATVTVALSSMTNVQLGQEIKLNNFGNFPMLLQGTVNGQTDLYVSTQQNQPYRYCGSSWGWN